MYSVHNLQIKQTIYFNCYLLFRDLIQHSVCIIEAMLWCIYQRNASGEDLTEYLCMIGSCSTEALVLCQHSMYLSQLIFIKWKQTPELYGCLNVKALCTLELESFEAEEGRVLVQLPGLLCHDHWCLFVNPSEEPLPPAAPAASGGWTAALGPLSISKLQLSLFPLKDFRDLIVFPAHSEKTRVREFFFPILNYFPSFQHQHYGWRSQFFRLCRYIHHHGCIDKQFMDMVYLLLKSWIVTP